MVNKKEEKKEDQKPTVPINPVQLFQDFFSVFTRTEVKIIEDNRSKYVEPLINEILKGNDYPQVKINLGDIQNEDLLNHVRRDPFRAIDDIHDALKSGFINFNQDAKKLMQREGFRGIQILFEAPELYLPVITDLSKDLNPYSFKLCKFIVANKSIYLEKKERAILVVFCCKMCGLEFEVLQLSQEMKWPSFCLNKRCRAKGKSDFEEVKNRSITVSEGRFYVSNTDNRESYVNMECRTTGNFDYFEQKIKEMNINERIEIIGVREREIINKSRNEYREFIIVIDFKATKNKDLDLEFLKILKQKCNDFNYFERAIDAISPLTYMVDSLFLPKLIVCECIPTGGSWNLIHDIRDTLNGQIGGPAESYKSRIFRNTVRIMGPEHIKHHEIMGTETRAGIIGTTQREEGKATTTVRLGVLPNYSSGTIIFDEGQNAGEEFVSWTKCIENGETAILKDGVDIPAKTRASIIWGMNYVKDPLKKGNYNDMHDYTENIGWDHKLAETLLDRYDLYCVLREPDTFIQLRINQNQSNMNNGALYRDICKDLEIDDYPFPPELEKIKSDKNQPEEVREILYLIGKLSYFHHHFLQGAKQIYPSTLVQHKFDVELSKMFDDFMMQAEKRIGLRPKNTALRILRVLAALRQRTTVGREEFSFLKKYGLKTMLCLRDNNFIEKTIIDVSNDFEKIFQSYVIDMNRFSITISEVVKQVRAFIQRNYYSDKSEQEFKEEIDAYMPLGYDPQNEKENATLKKNWPLKKLLKNMEDWLNQKGYEIVYRKKKETIISKIVDFNHSEVQELAVGMQLLFEDNDYNELNEKDLIQVLEVQFSPIDREYLERVIDCLVDKNIIEVENNKVKWNS